MSKAAICCFCSTASIFSFASESLLPTFFLLFFGEIRGGGRLAYYCYLHLVLGRRFAVTGDPHEEGGRRVLVLDSPLVALLFCLGGCLLGPRGLLQLAVLVAMMTFALSWGERG